MRVTKMNHKNDSSRKISVQTIRKNKSSQKVLLKLIHENKSSRNAKFLALRKLVLANINHLKVVNVCATVLIKKK